jgi:transaldolase
MRALSQLGQSVWLDYLHRDMTRSGALEQMVHDGLLGMTSNPTIFERALASGDAYDRGLRELVAEARRLWQFVNRPNVMITIPDPTYSDIRYVQALIGSQTITTVPPDTLRLFEDHGVAELSLPGDSFRARRTMNVIAAAGIRFSHVNLLLEEDGLAKGCPTRYRRLMRTCQSSGPSAS